MRQVSYATKIKINCMCCVQLKISCKQQLLNIDFLLMYRKLLNKVKKTNTFFIVRIVNGEHHPIVGEGNVNLTLPNKK
jgi:hypothetical protein